MSFRTLSLEEVTQILLTPMPTLILFHRNPDADAVGSAFALKETLASLGSPAFCVCPNQLPRRLDFLTDGKQSGVTVKDLPADFKPERIVSVDVASLQQLGELADIYGNHVDLMIDHHKMGTPFADSYILPEAAATGEILFDLIKPLASEGLVSVTESLCRNLYAAISSDTGCFRYSNVTSDTHLRAAELVASGIDCADINHRLFESKSLDVIRAMGAGTSNLRFFEGGKLAVITFPYALKIGLGLADEDLECLVDVARSVEGVLVAVAIRQPSADGSFRVSMRSACDFDVAAICASFGGGGHTRAAGCTVEAASMEEAVEKISGAVSQAGL